MMQSNNDELCSTCAAIDFESLFYPLNSTLGHHDDSPNVRLGTLKEIIARSDKCPVCRLIVDLLRERHKQTPREHFKDVFYGLVSLPEDGEEEPKEEVEEYGMHVTWDDQDIGCCIEPQYFCQVGEYVLDEEKVHGNANLYVQRLLIKLEPSPFAVISFMATDWVRLHAIWSKNDSPHDSGQVNLKGRLVSRMGSGRQVHELLDIPLVQGWLHKCENEHGDKCSNPAWLGGSDDNWLETCRAIDVKERRIVNLPPQSRYIALSYVWGSCNQTPEQCSQRRLTVGNFSRLAQANGLDAVSLPKTVEDAIELTAKMGERYLWVDALCIIQDDIKDLSYQTSRMDQVYSRAVFTIIAACGDDSEAGLAGLPGRERDILKRSVRVSPGGLNIAPTAGLFVNAPLELSTWNSRGWTFQERLLSKRVLVFTSWQVFWLCEVATWDEEAILELPEPRVRVQPQSFGCNDEWDDGYPKFSKDALDTYITQFCMREFTFPADVLPAFLGVIRRYEHLNKEKIHWGLPTERFDQALVWKHGTERLEEKYRVVSGDSQLHEVSYPSWSWLGWTGFISPSHYNEYLAEKMANGELGPELVFYSLMSDGDVELVGGAKQPVACDKPGLKWKGETVVKGPVIVENSIVSRMRDIVISGEEATNPPAKAPTYDTGRLVFWTSHASVKARAGEEKLPIEVEGQELELKASFSRSSRASLRQSREEGDESSPGQPEGKPNVDLIFISRFYEIAQSEETGKLNVMIVEQEVPGSEVWSRLGMAVIEETDWIRLEPRWEMVILA